VRLVVLKYSPVRPSPILLAKDLDIGECRGAQRAVVVGGDREADIDGRGHQDLLLADELPGQRVAGVITASIEP